MKNDKYKNIKLWRYKITEMLNNKCVNLQNCVIENFLNYQLLDYKTITSRFLYK